MLTATSIARMVVPPLALVATGGAVLFFVVTQVRREPPVEAGTVAAVGAASLAASQRSSDGDDEFTPIFDIVRIEATGEAVIAGRAAPNAAVELLHNDYVHDRAVTEETVEHNLLPRPRGVARQPNWVRFAKNASFVLLMFYP